MYKWITGLALSTLLAAGMAVAQETKPAPPASASQPAQPAQAAPAPALPNVESADILKQNQAERNRVQPGNNAPVWRAIKDGGAHYSSLPGAESGVLIQPKAQFPGQAYGTTAGEAWRQYRNGPLTSIGAGLLLAVLFVMVLLYFIKGPVRNQHAPTGRLIERFTPAERFVHWAVAISFVLLAATGIIILFGKHFLLPLLGHTLFSWLGYACKNIHNFVGPLFTVSIIVFFVMYVRDNLPAREDLGWLARLGGLVGGKTPRAGRFNAGEKIWFWGGLTVLGLVVSASGFVLDMLVPGLAYTRADMQVANIVHVVGTVLMMAGSIGHIYLGTVGMEGAYQGMRHGYVDDTWAREHHDLWYEQVQNGDVPRVRSRARAQQRGPDEAPALKV
ncbi:MAG TPA: formate dehydrogenase subunit gamma [Noviherbaspirillum sp.]|jgi:formate dehydrogenase subunit gamma|uniref:formate dehydrogenase subunit gamma n=1 Tax=Noviherbaspirillum sp. TaxID=1926288 RepID=UPI002F93FD41